MGREEVLDCWKGKWLAGKAQWHESEVNACLIEFFPKVCQCPGKCKVFVPLCGKTLEMKWLVDQGCEVVGVECSKLAVEEFFSDHNYKYEVTKLSDGDVYKCLDKPITLYNCDFFSFPSLNENDMKFDFIWDRGSLAAIEKCDRESYAEILQSLMKAGTAHLVEGFLHDEGYEDSPKNLTIDELQQLTGDSCEYELLKTLDCIDMAKERFNFDFTFFNKVYYFGRCKK